MVVMADPQKPRQSIRTMPFDDQARRAIRTQAEEEARKVAEKRRAEFEMKVAVTEHLTGRLPRDGMAPVFFAAARRIAMDLLLGNTPIRNGTDASSAITALMSAGRMETGMAGAEDITKPPADREEAEKRLKAMQDEVAARRKRNAEDAAAASGE